MAVSYANNNDVVTLNAVDDNVRIKWIDTHRRIKFASFSRRIRRAGKKFERLLQALFIFFDLEGAELVEAVHRDTE